MLTFYTISSFAAKDFLRRTINIKILTSLAQTRWLLEERMLAWQNTESIIYGMHV